MAGAPPRCGTVQLLLAAPPVGGGKSQRSTKEELLKTLLQGTPHVAGEISAGDAKPSLNEASPQETSASPPSGFLPHEDSIIQGEGEALESQVNKKLTDLLPNTPVRKLISRMIRILKIDCTSPTLWAACAKLITKTDLIKLFSKHVKETSSLWNFLPSLDAADTTTGSTPKREKPSGRLTNAGIPANGYGNKLFLAFSVTIGILIIIVVLCLIVVWSQRSTAMEKSILGKEKKTLPDEEIPRTPSPLRDKPFWLKYIYSNPDELQNNTLFKVHNEESFEIVDMTTWSMGTPPLREPSITRAQKILSEPMLEQLIPLVTPPPSSAELAPPPAPPPPSPPPPPAFEPPPPAAPGPAPEKPSTAPEPSPPPPPPPVPEPPPPTSTPSEKSIEKKSSETTEATSPKAASSTAEEDIESSAGRSENPASTEVMGEGPESGEGDEEGEGEREVEDEEEESD